MSLPRLAPQRLFALICIGVAVLIGLGALWAAGRGGSGAGGSGSAAIGGRFDLVNQDGQRVNQTLLKGKWSAVFFGYTFCPDVCPTTLQTLGRAQDLLGPKAKDLQIVFVTVDPGRDTPRVLKDYLGNAGFPRGAIGLTGTPEQVQAATRAYRVIAIRQGDGDDYLMDHSVVTYLMSPQGRFDSVIAPNQTPDQVAQQIRQRMHGG